MSKSVLYDIHCDGVRCGAWAGMSDDVTPGRTPAEIRRHLRTQGWLCHGDDDRCPPCADKIRTGL